MALASPIYVVNELLMYVISKLDADNQNDIKNVVNTFYGDEAVSDAKSLLWEHYSSKLLRIACKQIIKLEFALIYVIPALHCNTITIILIIGYKQLTWITAVRHKLSSVL